MQFNPIRSFKLPRNRPRPCRQREATGRPILDWRAVQPLTTNMSPERKIGHQPPWPIPPRLLNGSKGYAL